MKFLRVGEPNKEIAAVLDKENKIRSLSNHINDLNPSTLNFNTINKIKDLDFESLSEIDSNIRIGPCISNPGNFFAIGLKSSRNIQITLSFTLFNIFIQIL